MPKWITYFIVALLGLFIAAGLFGCGMSVDDQIKYMNAMVDVAQKSGVEGSVDVDLPTRVDWSTRTGLGSDGHIRAKIRVNPNAARNLEAGE